MAQLIFIVLVGSVCWLVYKRFIQAARRLQQKSHRQESERRTGAIGTLVKDPVTGEYRVKRDDE
jgi:membrane protein implicated in regulation of membrane protease activity